MVNLQLYQKFLFFLIDLICNPNTSHQISITYQENEYLQVLHYMHTASVRVTVSNTDSKRKSLCQNLKQTAFQSNFMI